MLSNLKSEGQNQRAPMQAWPKIIKTSQWHRVVSVCEAAGAHLPSWDVRHSIPEQELLPESPSSAVSLPWGWKEVDVNKRLYLSLHALEGQCFAEDLLIQQRVKWTLGQLDLATGCPCERAAILSHVDASCLKFSDLRGSSECLEHSRLLVNMCWLNKWRCIHNSVLVPMVFFKFNNLWSKARR